MLYLESTIVYVVKIKYLRCGSKKCCEDNDLRGSKQERGQTLKEVLPRIRHHVFVREE
jgi:hypothetical protein